jgi:predicted metal-dependent phosphoesterase TrpH
MVHIYPGAIHIHTTYSDGTSDISQVVRAAKKAGLKWIVVTDHNNMDGLGHEGFHDGVAVIVGEEISLILPIIILLWILKTLISHEQTPADYVNEVKKQGGFGFIAHPDERPFAKPLSRIALGRLVN